MMNDFLVAPLRALLATTEGAPMRVFLLIAFLSIFLIGAARAGRPAALSFDEFRRMEEARGLVAAASENCGADPTQVPDASCQQLRQELRYVVYVGKQIYCYWEEKKRETGTDFDALAREIELSITDATTYSEHFLALRRWAAAFHDGHVNALSADDTSQLELYTSPVRLEVFAPATPNEKLVVQAVTGSLGNISAGDQVLEVNGVPAAEAISRAVPLFASGSTEAMRRRGMARRLVDVIGSRLGMEPFTLKVVHKGVEEIVSIPRKAELQLPPRPNPGQPGGDEDSSKLITAQVMPGGLGYLRIDAFIGNMGELLDVAMDRLQGTRGLVIDVRANGGGDQSGSRVLARLIDPEGGKLVRYKVSPRNSDYILAKRPYYYLDGIDAGLPFAPWENVEVAPAPAAKGYRGKPIAVLTGPACFSACDTFVAALQAHGLATVVGEPTGGGTGSPLELELPHTNLGFRYSVVRGLSPKGEAIEGRGTQPDLPVTMLPEDRFAGKDLQLEAALKLVAEKSGAPMPPEHLRPVIRDEQSLDVSPTRAEDSMLKRLTKSVEY